MAYKAVEAAHGLGKQVGLWSKKTQGDEKTLIIDWAPYWRIRNEFICC